MYPSLPFKTYGYGDFIQFNVGSYRNIPGDQVPYVLANVANDAVHKANGNLARMYVYNKLCANNWYNDDFVNISRTILAIISGRLHAGVDMTHIANDVIERYLTCYTSVQVLLVPELKSQLAPNLVLAAQHNASQFQQFNEEANKVFMNQNNQQMVPTQQGMQPMMPMQPMQPMQPGMMPMQPGMMPMQQGMQPMMPMQPGMQMQPMMPMQRGMMPMQQGMQPMMPMQPNMQSGFTYQGSQQNYQQSDNSGKYNDVPEAYKVKETNVFTKAAENISPAPEPESKKDSKPVVVYLTKDSPDNFIKVGDKVISFDNVLQTKYSDNFQDKRFFESNPSVIGCLKEAVEVTRSLQIENQAEKYIYQAYSAAYYIVNEQMTIFSCSDVINELLLATTSFEEFAKNLGAFYKVIEDQMSALDKNNNDRELVEIYEKFKFARSIENQLVIKINNQLNKVYGLNITVDNFYSDAIQLPEYISKKYGGEVATNYTRFANDLVSALRSNYREDQRLMANKYMSSAAEDEVYAHKFEYQIQNVYVVNVPISKDNYSNLKVNELSLREYECLDIAQWFKTAIRHSRELFTVSDMYAVTLDDEVFQVHYNPVDKIFNMKKIELR